MSDGHRSSPILNYIIIALLAVVAIGFFRMSSNNTSVQAGTASIVGEIDFNGVKPDSDDAKQGEIKLTVREHNTDDAYENADVSVALVDGAQWTWREAEAGKTYDIIAEYYYDGDLVKKSDRAVATAPATGVTIVFNITNDDIPEEHKSESAPEAAPELVTISGVYTIHGYVPQGSTIRVYGRKLGDADFVEVYRDISAKNGIVIGYDKAEKGVAYQVQAELYNANGQFIGESAYITVTAPAQNEQVVINSTASAPVSKGTISGDIRLNGKLDENSTVLLLARKHGESEYQALNRYPAKSHFDFKWTEAAAGTMYDITAVLQVNEKNTASGTVTTVAAPAKDVSLELDTNFNLPAPDQKPQLSCGDRDDTNHYNAKISLPQKDEAREYYLQVGSSAGSNNIFNDELDPNETATMYLQGDTSFYARYSYTSCTDCDTSDSTHWSGWSPTLGFKCPN